jgi:hypothetical protein
LSRRRQSTTSSSTGRGWTGPSPKS